MEIHACDSVLKENRVTGQQQCLHVRVQRRPSWAETTDLGSEFSLSFECLKKTSMDSKQVGARIDVVEVNCDPDYHPISIPIYIGILLGHKNKQWNSIICSNMEGPRNYHTKWSQVRQRQISYNITNMWNLIFKNDTNELVYEIETDSQILKQTYGYQRGNVGCRGIN